MYKKMEQVLEERRVSETLRNVAEKRTISSISNSLERLTCHKSSPNIIRERIILSKYKIRVRNIQDGAGDQERTYREFFKEEEYAETAVHIETYRSGEWSIDIIDKVEYTEEDTCQVCDRCQLRRHLYTIEGCGHMYCMSCIVDSTECPGCKKKLHHVNRKDGVVYKRSLPFSRIPGFYLAENDSVIKPF